MLKGFKAILLTGLIFIISLAFTETAYAASISNVQANDTAVPVYEKFEVTFDVATSSEYPLFSYDEDPPAGVEPGIGITVEAVITTPSNEEVIQPAFYMNNVVKTGSGASMKFRESTENFWAVRYSPFEEGQYSLYLRATDADGTDTSEPIQFTATNPSKPGFIGISPLDGRYFSFSNGELFWPTGPIYWDGGGTFNYAQYANSGLNLSRAWLGGLGIYSTNWARWISSGEEHGNEGFMSKLNWEEKAPGSELSYEISYPDSFRIWLSSWRDSMFHTTLSANRTYRVFMRYKAQNISGPQSGSGDYGLVVKNHDFLSISESEEEVESQLASRPTIVPHLGNTEGWVEQEFEYSSGGTVYTDFSIYLDNVSSGEVYIDEFSIREKLAGGQLGPEIIRNPKADIHTYVDQRPAAFVDWQLEQAEQYGIYFRYVVHDKNDWIQNHLVNTEETIPNDCEYDEDTLFTDDCGGGYYQPEDTKARWLLRQWYRYLVARWGYSTAVHSWELNNEGPPDESPASSGTAPHWRTAEAFGEYMQTINPHPQMTTTSFWCCWRPNFWGSSNFPHMSFGDVHEYSGNPQLSPQNFTNNVARWMLSMAQTVFEDAVGKPVMLGEAGLDDSSLDNENSGVWYHNMLWAGLHPGALTSPLYWYSSHISAIDAPEIAKAFQNFVDRLDVHEGGYVPAEAESSNEDIEAIGQKNLTKDRAHLWIRNVDHIWTAPTPSPVSADISLSGFDDGEYTIEWFDTFAGEIIDTTTVQSSDGTISFSVTDLATDLAVYIRQTADTIFGSGDVNEDGSVTVADILALFEHWFTANSGNPDQYADGIINSLDFAVVYMRLLATPTPSPTPEPTEEPTPEPTEEPTPEPTPSPTPEPTEEPTPTPSPSPSPTATPEASNSWSQHAFNAQRTSYQPEEVSYPWRWKWAWNGPDGSGAVASGKFKLPRNVQPVFGDGKLFVAAGNNGLYAISAEDGSVSWSKTNIGTINSTAAYDAGTNSVFALSTNGVLYQLDAEDGETIDTYSTSESSTAPLPPAIANDRVFITMGDTAFALTTSGLDLEWSYTHDSNIHTPPSYSSSEDLVIFAGQDLVIVAVDAQTGDEVWTQSVNTLTGLSAGDPGSSSNNSFAQVLYGWPVIADEVGVVLVKLRLDWQTIWTWDPWPTSNSTMRSNLTSQPTQQALIALNLDDGSQAFIPNIGHGGYGDNDYQPMGPQPVIKTFEGGGQVAYMVGRGDDSIDGRWDSKYVELVLDSSVEGYEPGDVRFIQHGVYGWSSPGDVLSPSLLTDEQPNISMAGDHLFGGHWAIGHALEITNRSASRGSYSTPITSTWLSYFVTSTNSDDTSFSSSHYVNSTFGQRPDYRPVPRGFYIYYNQGAVYDQYWSEYATWVVSDGLVVFRSNDGAIVALESGTP